MGKSSSNSLILWAEDDDNEVVLVERAFAQKRVPNALIRVHDGEEVIQYLTGEGRYGDRAKYPLPSLLLLDVKMPFMNGFEVLKWKKSQPQFRDLPAAMYSSSCVDRDVETAHRLGADAYLVKPVKPEELAGIIETLLKLGGQGGRVQSES